MPVFRGTMLLTLNFQIGWRWSTPEGDLGVGCVKAGWGVATTRHPQGFRGFCSALAGASIPQTSLSVEVHCPPPLLSLLLDGLWRGDDPWGSNQASLRTASEPYDVQSLDRTTGSSHFYRAILNACMCLCLRTRPPARMAVCATHRQPS